MDKLEHKLLKNNIYMIFDFEMINAFYKELPSRISEIRKKLNHPLTLSEKILYSHLFEKFKKGSSYNEGVDYVDFAPDRVAMQDATAQMALLQFMMAGERQYSCSCFSALRSSYYGKIRGNRRHEICCIYK